MNIVDSILMHMFGRPKGILGKLGGIILARTNREFAYSVIGLLDVQANDRALEVGFGPGVGIQLLAKLASAGYVTGVDYSEEMVEQATVRNREEIAAGLVDLRQGSVESLPFENNIFDKVLAINSMQVWSDTLVGLREMRRVMKVGGRMALGFTPNSGQSSTGLTEMLTTAGFTEVYIVETDHGGFCALATIP